MPCRHGGHDNGDVVGDPQLYILRTPQRVEASMTRELLIGRTWGRGHHTSQEDTWLCEKEYTTSMPALPAAVSPPSADTGSAEVLFSPDLPGGEQEGESAALATEAGKPRLLLRCAARESRAGQLRLGVPGLWCAVERRVSRLGGSPTRQLSFRPVAIGAVVEETKRPKPSV